MNPKYSLIYLTAQGHSPAELIDIAAEAGYDCVDARTISMGLPGEMEFNLAGDKRLFRETRAAVSAAGVTLDSIENARIFDGVEVKDYEGALEAAANLGVRHVLSNVWSEDRGYAQEHFSRLCELAAQYGQTVDLEFVTWSAVKNIRDARNLLEAVQAPNAGILVDTLHYNRSGVCLDELQALPAEWLYCIHICDAPAEIPDNPEQLAKTAREERLFPGKGGINIREIVGGRSWAVLGVEIPNRRSWERLGFREHACQALRMTKEYLGSV